MDSEVPSYQPKNCGLFTRCMDTRLDRSNKSNNYTYNEVKLILRSRYIDIYIDR